MWLHWVSFWKKELQITGSTEKWVSGLDTNKPSWFCVHKPTMSSLTLAKISTCRHVCACMISHVCGRKGAKIRRSPGGEKTSKKELLLFCGCLIRRETLTANYGENPKSRFSRGYGEWTMSFYCDSYWKNANDFRAILNSALRHHPEDDFYWFLQLFLIVIRHRYNEPAKLALLFPNRSVISGPV